MSIRSHRAAHFIGSAWMNMKLSSRTSCRSNSSMPQTRPSTARAPASSPRVTVSNRTPSSTTTLAFSVVIQCSARGA